MQRRETRPIVVLIGAAAVVALVLLASPVSSPSPERPSATSTTAVARPSASDGRGDVAIPEGLAVPTALEDPSGHALDRFHAALRRAEAGEGRARVLFYGASHTAADHLPGHVRRALSDRFGDGGRGFTLPATPSTRYDYWQWGAVVEDGEGWERVRLGVERGEPDHYGIAGIVFDSGGREAVARVSNEGSAADIIEVHYQAMPDGGAIDVWIDGAEARVIETDAEEVGLGREVFEVEEGHHALELRAQPGAPVRIYGVVFERSGPGVVVDNVALTGSRARYHDKWREPVYTDHLRLRAPDLLVLWYGGNEGNDYRGPADLTTRELRRMLTKLRGAVPDASCVIMGPADKPLRVDDDSWVHRPRTMAISRASRAIAFAHGCAFFDTVAFMGGPLSMLRWVDADPPLARDDYIHFSATGYRLLSETLLVELLAGYTPDD